MTPTVCSDESIMYWIEPNMALIGGLSFAIHDLNKKWWINPATGKPITREVDRLLMLMVSELSEAYEGYRKGKNDDHLPHRSALEVELADLFIRLLDTAAGLNLDLAGAVVEKMRYNLTRADHKPENRIKEGGKKF